MVRPSDARWRLDTLVTMDGERRSYFDFRSHSLRYDAGYSCEDFFGLSPSEIWGSYKVVLNSIYRKHFSGSRDKSQFVVPREELPALVQSVLQLPSRVELRDQEFHCYGVFNQFIGESYHFDLQNRLVVKKCRVLFVLICPKIRLIKSCYPLLSIRP